jgi:DNA-binding NtrC family response regulator
MSDREAGPREAGDVWFVVSSTGGLHAAPMPRKKRVIVGRSRSCDVVIDDTSVSREHAALFDVGGQLRVEDLGSRNGTRVMGQPVAPGATAPVALGSVLSIGHATLLLQRGAPGRGPERAGSHGEPSEAEHTVVRDATMQRLHALLDVIAPSSLNVVLLGETGTGKEVFAEALHARSHRAGRALVRVNCAGLTGTLLESELFGHEKGAFTGAQGARGGLFEAAHGGTLFLDEIGEMPLDTQAKVLRVIEHGEVTRLGSTTPRKIDVRYVAATHRDLLARGAEGLFRMDLFFRLNGYTMTLPPLRERKDEIGALAQLFLDRVAPPSHARRALGRDVVARLEAHAWPGNVRELKNVIERAAVLAGQGPITGAHLLLDGPASALAAVPAPPAPLLRSGRSSFEYQHIQAVLEQTQGDRKAAAALLGIAYRTLLEKLAENGHPSSRRKR